MIKQFLPTIFFLVVSAAAVSAQSSVEQAAKSARDRFSDVKNRSIELERMKRSANKRPTGDNSAPKFPEIKEDFEEIQKINSGVIELIAKSPVNYAAVLKFVSEINRRAIRLKSNLFSAESEQNKDEKNKRPTTVELPDIPALLDALDKSVNSFVHSSLFQNVRLVNTQDSLNAQKDLDTIIKTSFSLKEKVKKISKDNSKK